MDTIQTEVRRRSNELEHLRKREENEQIELDRLNQQHSSLSANVADLKKDKAGLERERVEIEEKIAELKQ